MVAKNRAVRVVILGAAGRDFHNFNVVYRDDPAVEVVAFTAAQIPGIANRRYPAALAGKRYPQGIPIVAEADLEKTKAVVVESRKNLVVAQNTVDYQLARLGDTLIAAPFEGLIIRRDRDPGDVVVPGTSIFLLISTQSLWVRTWIDETEMQRVTEGQRARVVFRAEPETIYIGKVARLGRETDRETREFLVDVEIERLPRNWSVGQRADVFIETAHKDGVTIVPSQLIVRNQGEIGVIKNHDGRAVWQPVKVGLRGHAQVEIVAGLSPGDIVVYNQGPDLVPEGRRLEISNREPGR